MSKYQPKHAKPRGKRGNKYTPWIHGSAIISSFLVTTNNIKGMTTLNFLASFARTLGLFVALEIAFAVVYSAIAVLIVEYFSEA